MELFLLNVFKKAVREDRVSKHILSQRYINNRTKGSKKMLIPVLSTKFLKGDVGSKTIYEIWILYLKDVIFIASMKVFLSSVHGKKSHFY